MDVIVPVLIVVGVAVFAYVKFPKARAAIDAVFAKVKNKAKTKARDMLDD